MNQTQLPTSVAPFVAFFAGLLAGKGVFGLDTATWTIVLGAVGGAIMTVWGALATRKTALVSAVGAMAQQSGSGVNGVITANTPEGRALADSIPASTVAVAGSADAGQIARTK